jgi:hypothetical protein
MEGFLSFVLSVLFPIAIGFAVIYVTIDFFEFLKKNHSSAYKQMSFDRIFGISADNLPFHLIKPLAFIRFLLSSDNLQDHTVSDYTKKIKLLLLVALVFVVLYFLFTIFF